MAVVFNKKNNIKLEIKAPLTSVGTLLVVDKGTLLGEDFANDETKNFSLTLFKLEGDVPVQIEISEVIAKSGNNLTLRRAVEPCPMNYGAGEMVQQAYDFDVGDVAYMNLTAGDIENMVKEFEKINKNLTDNYLKTSDFNALKGQPGGIATLDQNGTIPMSEINTSNLDIQSTNITLQAGESISAGNAVCITNDTVLNSSNIDFTKTENIPNVGRFTITYTSGEINVGTSSKKEINFYGYTKYQARDNYKNEAKVQIYNFNTNALIKEYSTYTYQSELLMLFNITLTNNFIQKYKVVITLNGYTLNTTYYSPKMTCNIAYESYTNVYLKKAIFDITNKCSNFIGFANNAASSGQNVNVITNGVYTFNSNNLKPGSYYYLSKTSKGQIYESEDEYGYAIGQAVSNNKILIKPANKILNISTTNQTLFTHNMGKKAKFIYKDNILTQPLLNSYNAILINPENSNGVNYLAFF